MSTTADLPAAPTTAPASAVDYGRASRRLTVALALGGYLFVALFLTLASALAFGANRDPTPTELAFAVEALWLPPLAAALVALSPGGEERRRARAAAAVWAVGVAGFALAAAVGRARHPGYPVSAPAEAIALRYVVVGGVPGLVAVAVVAWREGARALARVAAPAGWALAVVGVALGSARGLSHPLRDALPGSATFRRLEFFNRTGSSRYVLRADLSPAEATAYFAALGLQDKPGAMPPWEYPIADWWTPPRGPGPRWMTAGVPPGGHGIHCSTFATYASGALFVQHRCDPE